MNGKEIQEGYERQPMTTQGEGWHHEVHFFYYFAKSENYWQEVSKKSFWLTPRLMIYINYTNGNPRETMTNQENDRWTQRWTNLCPCCRSFVKSWYLAFLNKTTKPCSNNTVTLKTCQYYAGSYGEFLFWNRSSSCAVKIKLIENPK